MGCVAIEVPDGYKALDFLLDPDRPTPALIVLDLSMPVMDGWEFLAIMNSYLRLRAVPVVLISASDHPQLDPLRHGTVAAHFRKPYDIGELSAVIYRLTSD